MRIRGRDPARREASDARCIDQHIDALRTARMAAFDKHSTGPKADEPSALAYHGSFIRCHAFAEQSGGLREIGRQEIGKREEQALHGLDRFRRGKAPARARDHDRIKNDVPCLPAMKPISDGGDELGARQQADLGCSGLEV